MEIINKNHKTIRENQKYQRFSPFIRISNKRSVGFPLSTVEMANLRIGQYIHFVDLGKVTCFMVNDDPAGYKLIANGPRDESLRFNSAAMVTWFRDKYKIKKEEGSVSFYVIESSHEYKGHKLYEILTNKRREVIKTKMHNKKN